MNHSVAGLQDRAGDAMTYLSHILRESRNNLHGSETEILLVLATADRFPQLGSHPGGLALASAVVSAFDHGYRRDRCHCPCLFAATLLRYYADRWLAQCAARAVK